LEIWVLVSYKIAYDLHRQLVIVLDWKNRVSAYSQGNKLRTYKLLKHDFCTEPYLEYKMPLNYRSAYAKLRCWVAPLRVETGWYERKAVHERTCLYCINC
jgi:hypothetical protein